MWTFDRTSGDAAAFHARVVPDDVGHQVWVFEVARPAIALGSSQPLEHLDVGACERAGVEVVRRRSGGGAVLLVPDEVVWVDLVVPVSSPLWRDDVVASADWVGRAWADALADIGVSGLGVHSGRLVESAWSRHVCFAGTGPGEVFVGGAKLVGISQRRTRAHARFQCAVHRRWQPELFASLFAPGGPTAHDIADCTAVVTATVDEVVAALSARLP